MDIVQLIYRPMEPLGAFKDFEFSRSTRRRDQASPSFAPMPEELGVRVFDVMHDILTRRSVACITQRRAPGALTTTETNWEGLRWH